jgi:hypothetical protein
MVDAQLFAKEVTAIIRRKLLEDEALGPPRKKQRNMAAAEMALPMPGLEHFFLFLRCQLALEAQKHFPKRGLLDAGIPKAFWERFDAFTRPNRGAKQKWVPFHTVLSPHELFLLEHVYPRVGAPWTPQRHFLALFIFRAHCRSEVFLEAQLGLLETEEFWMDPVGMCRDDGPLEEKVLSYRRRTKRPLQTGAFQIFDARLVEDTDLNRARNLVRRTGRLLEAALDIWLMMEPSLRAPQLLAFDRMPGSFSSSRALFGKISKRLYDVVGVDATWVKMLMVSTDLAFPRLQLLNGVSEVGIGAKKGLRRLLEIEATMGKAWAGPLLPGSERVDHKPALEALTRQINATLASTVAEAFWEQLARVEHEGRQHYSSLPLVVEQMSTVKGALGVATVQVQLCEWQQFLRCESKFGPG